MTSLIQKYGYHEWLSKSYFSFLKGASSPRELIELASDFHYRSFCLNDYDGFYGSARLYRENLKLGSPLKLQTSTEVHILQDHELPLGEQLTFVLIAQDKRGYEQICRLISYAHRESKDKAFCSLEQIQQFELSHTYAMIPMRGMIRKDESQMILRLKDIFGQRLYFALSRLLNPYEDYWLDPTWELITKTQSHFVISQDIFFHDEKQKRISDLVQAIRKNCPIDQAKEFMFPNSERRLHSLLEIEALYERFPFYQQALIKSRELAESCNFCLSQLRYQYPQEMIPKGLTAFEYLSQLTREGAQERFPMGISEKIFKLIDHELELIRDLGFSDYFLTVWDIVNWARSQKILCQGRGSAANSVVCYVLGITSVDPSQFDLLFERFISKERGDPPDIDVDFEHERREEVIQYVYRRYGRNRAAMVANVITYKKRGALRASGKALGIDEAILKRASKLCSSKYSRSFDERTLLRQVQEEFEIEKDDFRWTLWPELAKAIKGFPRHLGIHSGGFLLTHEHLDQLIPREPATMEGRTVVQWSKEDIEALNFFKIDLLCLGMLTAVRKCFDLVRSHYGKNLSLYSLPIDDEATFQMIQKADTVGVFQIESRAQMSMLPRLKPKCFYDLVIEVAIIRPGPIQGDVIHPFLRRRDGLEPVTYPDKRLEPILKKTLGVAIFQEQAMRIAIAVGDFTPGEADELRKNIGVWNIKEFERDLNPWILKLQQGMVKNGIDPQFIEQILGQMRGFAHYGFPESHAVSFALIAYASCFLKKHYPAAFFTSILNSQPMGFYPPHSLLQAAKRDGVAVLPICINRSGVDHQLEKSKGEWAIRIGLRMVNHLSSQCSIEVVNDRIAGGEFKDFDDFCGRLKPNRDDLTALSAANVFENLGVNRMDALWKTQVDTVRPMVDSEKQKINWHNEHSMEKIQKDFNSFNTSLRDHPVSIFKRELWDYSIPLEKIIKSDELSEKRTMSSVCVFGMVQMCQAPGSAKGMVFYTLEDEIGHINLVFTPPIFEKFHTRVEKSSFLCVSGHLQKTGEAHSIKVFYVYERTQALADKLSFKVPELKGPSGMAMGEGKSQRNTF